ncbi:MAG TPA: recombinase family protein [Oscillatoriales cyanobacterium M59_W2019_021]|nr:MAG: recombinase family protein [Cyanobacteria bacterium J055]HIK29800.1 recombinase family protein [Oscillatoriales cyanobacterium M4454_W2019_049]HIK50580.1 recombinase family protein [Oscillatoriales cyanobacterium M59_W2019_021]
MTIVAYCYSDPLLEEPPDATIWGWEIDRVYQDLGQRQQLHQLLSDCQSDRIDYILVRRLEELGDSISQVCEVLNTLKSLGIELVATESDTHRANLLQLFAEIQRNQRSRRIRQGHARNRIEALPPPGKAPYGYRRGKDRYILDRSVAPVVKAFFDDFLIYGSLRGAVRHLAQRYGKKISVSTGRRWLTHPVYRGDLAYHNGQTIADTHIPIISREEAAQIDRLLRRNRRLPARTASAPRSLAGLAVCAACQSSMTVTRVTRRYKKQEYLYLRPTRCPQTPKCKAIAYEKVLAQTIEGVCRDLTRAVAGLPIPATEGIKRSIQSEIDAKGEILGQLSELLATGVLDAETANLRTYKLKTEIAELQAKLAQLPPVNLRETAQAVSIPEFWLDLSETERRFYFREFIRAIEIHRTDTPEESLCDRDWHLQIQFIF